MPISPANTIIRDFPNIIIDAPYDFDDVLTKEESMERVKAKCIKENLAASGEDPNRLDPGFKSIEKINVNNPSLYIPVFIVG